MTHLWKYVILSSRSSGTFYAILIYCLNTVFPLHKARPPIYSYFEIVTFNWVYFCPLMSPYTGFWNCIAVSTVHFDPAFHVIFHATSSEKFHFCSSHSFALCFLAAALLFKKVANATTLSLKQASYSILFVDGRPRG